MTDDPGILDYVDEDDAEDNEMTPEEIAEESRREARRAHLRSLPLTELAQALAIDRPDARGYWQVLISYAKAFQPRPKNLRVFLGAILRAGLAAGETAAGLPQRDPDGDYVFSDDQEHVGLWTGGRRNDGRIHYAIHTPSPGKPGAIQTGSMHEEEFFAAHRREKDDLYASMVDDLENLGHLIWEDYAEYRFCQELYRAVSRSLAPSSQYPDADGDYWLRELADDLLYMCLEEHRVIADADLNFPSGRMDLGFFDGGPTWLGLAIQRPAEPGRTLIVEALIQPGSHWSNRYGHEFPFETAGWWIEQADWAAVLTREMDRRWELDLEADVLVAPAPECHAVNRIFEAPSWLRAQD